MQTIFKVILIGALLLGGLAYLLNAEGGRNFLDSVMNRLSVGKTRQNLESAASSTRKADEDIQRQQAKESSQAQQDALREKMESSMSDAERSREEARARQEQMQDRLRAMQDRMNR